MIDHQLWIYEVYCYGTASSSMHSFLLFNRLDKSIKFHVMSWSKNTKSTVNPSSSISMGWIAPKNAVWVGIFHENEYHPQS